MNSVELHRLCADKLSGAIDHPARLTAFVGLDGFVDEIIHVVDKRDSAESFQRIPSIGKFAERIAAAAGRSTNFELVNARTKLGGNGPILANALASSGIKVTYLGALGYPHVHPVFEAFAKRAEVHSIAEPGHTDALEFDDGKLLMGKLMQLREVNWTNIQARYGRERFAAHFQSANLIGFVNWTMIPFMSEIWQTIQSELCPRIDGPRRIMFFDLADPEKRMLNDISSALELIVRFQEQFDVCLGLNEKEALELSKVLGLHPKPKTPDALAVLARELNQRLPISTIVIHPVEYALATSGGEVHMVQGPFVPKPVITTGAGDHFNAGFCLGKLLGFDNELCVLVGVTTSGFYVRTAQSPSVNDLVTMLRQWPVD